MYDLEEYKEYGNIMEYIKRMQYMFIVIKTLDNGSVEFEVTHSDYEAKLIEKLNFETNVNVNRIYLVNVLGEMVDVAPDFVGSSLGLVFKGMVNIEKNVKYLNKHSKYVTITSDNLKPIQFEEEIDVVDKVLRNRESIRYIFKVDSTGSIVMLDYEFNNFKVELKNSREWLRTIRNYRKLIKEVERDKVRNRRNK